MAQSPSPNTPSPQYRDKCLRQLATLNSELDRWDWTVKSGAALLESIGERKREQFGRRESEEDTAKCNEDTVLELQNLCEELTCTCCSLAAACADLEKVAGKLGSLANLDRGLGKVAAAAQVIARCLGWEKSLKM